METRSYEYPVGERVFRIDEECYVVYLGSGVDDYKPFLRIGNSRRLGDAAISSIHTIALTDSLTGDPLSEPDNLNRKAPEDNRYVGSEETIDRMLRLLKQLGVKTEKIPAHGGFHTEDGRAILTMFDNGNLSLSYDRTQIFDLKQRERADLHFVEKSKLLKDRLLKNHARYGADLFAGPGFFTVGTALFLFSGQAFTAFELPEDYFHSLVRVGLDPDLVTSVVLREPGADFVKLCKRKQFKGEPVTLLTGSAPVFRGLLELFESRTREPLRYTVEELARGSGKTAGEWSVALDGADYVAKNPSLPWPVRVTRKLASGSRKEFFINPWRGVAAYPAGGPPGGFRIVGGIPHVLSLTPPERKTLLGRYLLELSGVFSEGLTAAETNAVEFAGKVLEGYVQGKDVADKAETARKRLGEVKLRPDSPLYFVFHNVGELCGYLSKAGAGQSGGKAERRSEPGGTPGGSPAPFLSSLAAAADRVLEQSGKPAELHAPVVADCYFLSEGSFTLYRLSRSSIKKETIALSRALASETDRRVAPPHPFFGSERERLIAHMRSLAAPPARKKKQEEEKVKTSTGAAVSETKTAEAGARDAAAKPGLRPKKERHTLRTVLVVLGALAVVAAALLVPPVSLLDRSLVAMGLREKGTASGEMAGSGETAVVAQGAGSSLGAEGSQGAGAQGAGGQASGSEAGVQIPEVDRERIQTLISGSPVEITVLDIYNLVNEVAAASGFRRLDERPDNRRDPNLIFPDDALALPERTGHTVVKGDTIWWVSARFIKAQLNRDWRTYQSITGDLEKGGADAAAAASAIEKLTALKKGSYCGKFRKEVDNRIRALRAK